MSLPTHHPVGGAGDSASGMDAVEPLHGQILQAIPIIAAAVKKATDHDFQHYKPSTLVRRVLRRMRVLKIGSASAYADFVSRHEDEARALFRDLLIGVTAFFRDPEAFGKLKQDVLPSLFAGREPHDCVRIWVAGCANGAEAYTLAILCREVMEEIESTCSVQIFATDIDERALTIGRRGTYPLSIGSQISPERLNRFFVKRGKRYCVTNEIREMVLFSAHNLISDPPFSRQDLISCRNLLIYLAPQLQGKLVALFRYALNPTGYLLLGPSENIASHCETFRIVDATLRISQRKDTVLSTPAGSPFSTQESARPLSDASPESHCDLTQLMQDLVLEEFTPKSAVIDETGQLLTSSANINKFLNFTGGPPQTNIVKMAVSGLRIGLRAAIAEAKKGNRRVQRENLPVPVGDMIQSVTVTVQPISRRGVEESLYLVVFHEVGLPSARDAGSVDANSVRPDDDSVLAQLERELDTTRTDLDKSLQDMEAANEELKASNEELLSMNEELQSANEELESSKEEIRTSSHAIARAKDDLQNLLQSTQIATVFLDQDNRIRSFTPAISDIYPLIPTDVGRPLQQFVPHVQHMPPLPAVDELCAEKPVEHMVLASCGRSYMRRALPYQTHTGEIEGTVVTFTDITELRRSQEFFQLLVDTSAQIVWIADADGQITEDSPSWRAFTGQSLDQWRGRGWLDAVHPDDRLAILQAWKHSMESGQPLSTEYRLLHHQGEYRWTEVRAVAQRHADGSLDRWVGMNIDIHERRQWETALIEREHHLRNIIDATGNFIGVLDPAGTVLEVNELALVVGGLKREDVLGKPFWESVWWNFDPQISAQIRDFCHRVAQGESIRCDTLYTTGDGTVRPVDLSFNPIRDACGKVTHLVPSGTDILDRQTAENELRSSEELVRTIAENSTHALVMMDDRGYVTYCNQTLLELTGYDAQEIRSAPLHDLIHHHHPDGRPYPINDCPIDRALPEDFSVRAHQDLFFRKDGSRFEVLCAASPIFKDGRPISTVIEIRDVTEHNASQRALLNTQARLDLSLEVGNTAVWSWNIRTKEIVSNENLNRLFGFDSRAVPSAIEFLQRVHSVDRERIEKSVQRGVTAESHFEEEFRVVHPNGQMCWLRGRGRFLKPHGSDAQEVFGVVTDITARKRAEAELIEAKRKLDLAMQVSGIAAWSLNLENNTVAGGAELNRLFGIADSAPQSLDRLVGLIDEADRQRVGDAIAQSLQDGSLYDEEYRVNLPEGKTNWLRAFGRVVQSSDGQLRDFMGVVYDITDRKLREIELADREAHLRRVINNQLGLVGVIDRAGALLEIDDRSLAIAKARREDVIGVHFAETPWWNYDPVVAQQIRQAMQRAFAGEVVRFDVSLFAPTGQGVMIDFMIAPVTNQAGEIEYLIPSGVDISERYRVEQDIMQANTKLSVLFDQSFYYTGIIDLDGKLTEINDNALDAFGFQREDVLGLPFWETPWWRDQREAQAKLKLNFDAALAGNVYNEVLPLFRPDGALRYSDFIYTPAKNELGEVVFVVCNGSDVTERVDADRRMRASEERLRLALSAADLRLWQWDINEDRWYWPSGRSEQASSPSDVPAERLKDFLKRVHKADRHYVETALRESLDSGKSYRAEYRIQRGDELRWVLAIAHLSLPDDNSPLQMVGVELDISDRKQSELATRMNEERLRMAGEAAGFGTFRMDVKLGVCEWSSEIRRIIGYEDQHIAEDPLKQVPMFIHPDDRERFAEALKLARTDRGHRRGAIDHRILRRSGTICHVRTSWLSLWGAADGDSEAEQIIATTLDVSQQHEYEQQLKQARREAEAASESKSAFVANMSHEIRTPMTAILGYADLLAEHVQHPEAVEYINTIQRNGDYLLAIINDILDLSKIEAGKLEVEYERFHPARVIEDVRSIMEVRAREGGLQLDVEYDGKLPELIESDAKRLKQVLINLVGNAIKFTHEGWVRIRVRYESAASCGEPLQPADDNLTDENPANEHPAASGNFLHIDVIDSGIGMSQEHQARLFKPFSQGDASVSRNFGGTGLGLAISKRLCEMLGGEIVARSTEGVGSTFTVSIATGNLHGVELIDYDQGHTTPSTPLEPPTQETPQLSCRVLVVDDRRDIRFLSRLILNKTGATVDECEDGLQAVEHIMNCLQNKTCPDLILLDMQMPNLDGYQTARRLRELGYTAPIIALTADAMQGDMNECLEAGCNAYLSKPIDAQRLIQMVSQFIH